MNPISMNPLSMIQLAMAAKGAYDMYKGSKSNSGSSGSSGGGGLTYSGARPPYPPHIKEVEQRLFDIVMPRSIGIGVGFDPAKKNLEIENLTRQRDRTQSDAIRNALGRRSAAGLAGNVAAGEATEGKIERDINSDYMTALGNISIEDLTRANQERDVNTERLADFNRFNFGQANKVADFDAGIFGQESGNYFNQARLNLLDQERNDNMLGDFAELVGSLGGGNKYDFSSALNQDRSKGTGVTLGNDPLTTAKLSNLKNDSNLKSSPLLNKYKRTW